MFSFLIFLFLNRFIFLDVEASKVKVLEPKVKAEIRKLLKLIKSNLGGGSIVRRVGARIVTYCYRWI